MGGESLPWLTEQRRRAAELWAEGETSTTAIGKAVGVSHASIYNWKKRPEFQAEVRRLVEARQKAVVRRTLELTEQAHSTLTEGMQAMQEVMKDDSVAAADRIAAFKAMVSAYAEFGTMAGVTEQQPQPQVQVDARKQSVVVLQIGEEDVPALEAIAYEAGGEDER